MTGLAPEIPPIELLGVLMQDDPTIKQEFPPPGQCVCPRSAEALHTSEGLRRIVEPPKSDKYALLIVGLLSANLAVGLALLALGTLNYIRQRSDSRRAEKWGPHYIPVKDHAQDGSRRSSSQLALGPAD